MKRITLEQWIVACGQWSAKAAGGEFVVGVRGSFSSFRPLRVSAARFDARETPELRLRSRWQTFTEDWVIPETV